jgi:hypothetical protein
MFEISKQKITVIHGKLEQNLEECARLRREREPREPVDGREATGEYLTKSRLSETSASQAIARVITKLASWRGEVREN